MIMNLGVVNLSNLKTYGYYFFEKHIVNPKEYVIRKSGIYLQ